MAKQERDSLDNKTEAKSYSNKIPIETLKFLIWLYFLGLLGLFGYLVYAFGVGGALIGFGIWFTCIYFSHRKWPTTNGSVTHSEAKKGKGLIGYGDSGHDRMVLNYSYTVEGQKFDGSDYEYFPGLSHRSDDGIDELPKKGKLVTVYYNPRDHAESFLERGLSGFLSHLSLIFVGIIFTVMGSYNFWESWI